MRSGKRAGGTATLSILLLELVIYVCEMMCVVACLFIYQSKSSMILILILITVTDVVLPDLEPRVGSHVRIILTRVAKIERLRVQIKLQNEWILWVLSKQAPLYCNLCLLVVVAFSPLSFNHLIYTNIIHDSKSKHLNEGNLGMHTYTRTQAPPSFSMMHAEKQGSLVKFITCVM